MVMFVRTASSKIVSFHQVLCCRQQNYDDIKIIKYDGKQNVRLDINGL